MKLIVFLIASFCFAAAALGQTDSTIASVQQTLKDQGFYYGEVTGRKDADTSAAIRRYQIRNGLQITGDLNAETQKSLGVKGAIAAPPRATPLPAPRVTATPDTSDLRDDRPAVQEPARPADEEFRAPLSPPSGTVPEAGYAPGPRGLNPETSGIFDGTPYAVAPPELQRRVVIGAQTLLARRGYYRDLVDGVYGPGTEFAVRAYQARFEIEPDGRLNMETLAALGLLPGQKAPGLTAPSRRTLSRPTTVAPNGEPVYEPR